MTTPKRIRIQFNGAMIADTLGTSGALYVWEHWKYPQFYLPLEAFVKPAGFQVNLTPGEHILADDSNASTTIAGWLKLTVKRIDASEAQRATLKQMILFAADLQGETKILRNMVKVSFDAVGQWFEEDTPIYVHPRDPFKRVDILSTTSRPIRVSIGGKKIAQSSIAMHLYETTLVCRYYLPLTAVDTSVATLKPTKTMTQCPYKGDAGYYSVIIDGIEYEDICWYYTHPTPECASIAGMLCFYHEQDKVKVEVMGKGDKWEEVPRENRSRLSA